MTISISSVDKNIQVQEWRKRLAVLETEYHREMNHAGEDDAETGFRSYGLHLGALAKEIQELRRLIQTFTS